MAGNGITLRQCMPGSPAEACGEFRRGDVVVAVDDVAVHDLRHAKERIVGTPGTFVTIHIIRQDGTSGVVRLKRSATAPSAQPAFATEHWTPSHQSTPPKPIASAPELNPPGSDKASTVAGAGLCLSGQPSGVFVEYCVPGGPADKSGLLTRGDLVAAVDGRPVTGLADAKARICGPAGTWVEITRVRGGQSTTVGVTRANVLRAQPHGQPNPASPAPMIRLHSPSMGAVRPLGRDFGQSTRSPTSPVWSGHPALPQPVVPFPGSGQTRKSFVLAVDAPL